LSVVLNAGRGRRIDFHGGFRCFYAADHRAGERDRAWPVESRRTRPQTTKEFYFPR
jgi:hypothetical protein